ncbi:MAG: glycoside hydrolase family 2 protein [Spirochaetaceae bacterium]
MREVIRLNNEWLYNPKFTKEMIINSNTKDFELVNLPHANREIPYNYFDENDYQFISCYKKTFDILELNKGQTMAIRFEGVMTKAEVFVNGQYIGEHLGGYTPFEFNITSFVTADTQNVLTVVVDSRELENIPPFGGQIDYLTYGGIYREVELRIYDPIYIQNAKIETLDVLELKSSALVKLYIMNNSDMNTGVITVTLKDKTKEVTVNLEQGLNIKEVLIEGLEGIRLWDTENPNLYSVGMSVKTDNSSDYIEDRIGFRTCDFRTDGFYLNGEKLQIIGVNRHQSFPYVGYAAPKRSQIKDADIIKNELHMNLVRTSHYPQSIHFLNRCDELGLLVFEEIPGWQHIGDNKWQEVAINNVKEMIERDWNHPSVIIWGVRINESPDNDSFYSKTNKMAKDLDTTRQTGGVRCIPDSNLIEDVYTMNDFDLNNHKEHLRGQQTVTGLDKKVPYLVTEYNGHMFPTKRSDSEDRQIEHVNRHLGVQNAAFADPDISGAIGWCMYDYNTHKDFGSGDRICYHGIMDMFRIPKIAADVYKSQVDPAVEAVLKPVTYWARGERSVGGILPLTILTNCDRVELTYGNQKTFNLTRNGKNYNSLPYPPIVIDETIVPTSEIGEWGMKWEDGLLRGFVGGKMVKEVKLCKDPLPTNIEVILDDKELNSDEKDSTRVVVKVTDQYGQILPYFNEPVTIKLTGPARLLGPSVTTLKGGVLGFWVETKNLIGIISINISCLDLPTQNVNIEVM